MTAQRIFRTEKRSSSIFRYMFFSRSHSFYDFDFFFFIECLPKWLTHSIKKPFGIWIYCCFNYTYFKISAHTSGKKTNFDKNSKPKKKLSAVVNGLCYCFMCVFFSSVFLLRKVNCVVNFNIKWWDWNYNENRIGLIGFNELGRMCSIKKMCVFKFIKYGSFAYSNFNVVNEL